MRKAALLVLLAVFACGGSTVIVQGEPDAGSAEAGAGGEGGAGDGGGDGGGRDARADASTSTDAGCVDADITNPKLPDAALGDAGSVGKCVACAKNNCGPELQQCQDDCDCREAASAFFECIASGKVLNTCGSSLISGGAIAQSVGFCALNSGCGAPCGQAN